MSAKSIRIDGYNIDYWYTPYRRGLCDSMGRPEEPGDRESVEVEYVVDDDGEYVPDEDGLYEKLSEKILSQIHDGVDRERKK